MSRYEAKRMKGHCGIANARINNRYDDDRPYDPPPTDGDIPLPPSDYPRDADHGWDRKGELRWCIDKG